MTSRRLVAMLVGCAACGDSTGATDSHVDASRLCQQVDSIAAALPSHITIDDRFEALAAVLPGGYGGATSQFMVLVDPGKASLVAEAVRIGTSCPHGSVMVWSLAVRQQVVKGTYDFGQLARWKRAFYSTDISDLHLVLVDIAEDKNRLFFGVLAADDIPAVLARAVVLGVPQEALIVEVVAPFQPL